MNSVFVSVDYLVDTLFGIAFCVIAYLQYRYVIRTGRTEHLGWIYCRILACGIEIIYVMITDIHHFLGVQLNVGGWMALDLWYYLADTSILIGLIILLKMMLAGKIIVTAPVLSVEPDPEAWPPPPAKDHLP